MVSLKIATIICGLMSLQASASAAEYFGKFSDGPSGHFVENPSRPVFELSGDFTFYDPNGVRWTAPKGTVVDGASIPQAFWSIIGGPFEGAYLKASVIHDHYCVEKSKTAHDTHRNFYYGMRANNVSYWQAKAMYWAVATFGPSWIIEDRVGDGLACTTDPTTGVATCASVPAITSKVVSVPAPDLADPQVLSVALGKFNAIARTLKTTEGETLDLSDAGQITASLDSIEANARNFRQLMTTDAFKTNPQAVGILAEPRQMRLDTITNWPSNELPSIATTPKFDGTMSLNENAVTLPPGGLPDFSQKLQLQPMHFEMILNRE